MAPTAAAATTAANALIGSSGLSSQAAAFLSSGELGSLANFANPSPALTPPQAPTAGTALSNVNLFHFYDTSAGGVAGDTATIAWGDGTFSTVTTTLSAGCQIVVDPGGGYDVLGSHVYTQATLSPITLSVQVTNRAGTIGASDPNFMVLDAPLSAGALTPPAASQDVAFSNVVVFHFSDANSYATAGYFSAMIAWGDGTFSTVTSTLTPAARSSPTAAASTSSARTSTPNNSAESPSAYRSPTLTGPIPEGATRTSACRPRR